MKSAIAVIECNVLRYNLRRVRRLAPRSRIVAVVKANAYGHGLIEAALCFQKATCLGVARMEEALTLRAAGITQPILLLEGFFSAKALSLLSKHRIATVVHCVEQLEMLEQIKFKDPIDVWMKIDSGMHRLGVRPEEADEFYQRLFRCPNVATPITLMTHFSSADELDSGITEQQMRCFDDVVAGKAGLHSLAASSAILHWPASHRDWVRPGLMLYGISPLSTQSAADYKLKPAMTVQSRLIAVRRHKAGETVGYGAAWCSPQDTRLGVVAIGYGDGYPRCAPSGTPVWLNGREVPLVGRVSMDMITVDLGPTAQDEVGDSVELWGNNLPVERVAAFTGVSCYELVTRLTQRLQVKYVR